MQKVTIYKNEAAIQNIGLDKLRRQSKNIGLSPKVYSRKCGGVLMQRRLSKNELRLTKSILYIGIFKADNLIYRY